MKKLVIASNNKGKIKEFKDILIELPLEVVSLSDENIDIDVVEDGNTFAENAKKKAMEICDYLLKRGDTEFIVIADDSGIEVDYLNGEPGVYSARYAGEHGNDDNNNKKLLDNLKGVPWEERRARFVCELAIVDSSKVYRRAVGYVEGHILEEVNGVDGFGYDPLFYCDELKKSFGEAKLNEKNLVSHRGRALMEFEKIVKEII